MDLQPESGLVSSLDKLMSNLTTSLFNTGTYTFYFPAIKIRREVNASRK